MCGSDIFLGIIAILFPPVAVWVKRGICSADSLINIALWCLGVLPGVLHAWYIISIYPDPTYEAIIDEEREAPNQHTVTYYSVQGQGAPPRGSLRGQPNAQSEYGTVNSAPSQQFPQSAQGTGFVQPQSSGQAGGNEEVPPTYQQATSIGGDHKVQRP